MLLFRGHNYTCELHFTSGHDEPEPPSMHARYCSVPLPVGAYHTPCFGDSILGTAYYEGWYEPTGRSAVRPGPGLLVPPQPLVRGTSCMSYIQNLDSRAIYASFYYGLVRIILYSWVLIRDMVFTTGPHMKYGHGILCWDGTTILAPTKEFTWPTLMAQSLLVKPAQRVQLGRALVWN